MTSVTDPTIHERIYAIIKASRPPGWCFGPILFTIGFIHSRQSIPRNTTVLLLTVAQVFSLSFPLCAIVFGMNDVYDYDSDIRNPRKMTSGLEGGILAPVYHPSVRLAAEISSGLIILISVNTFGAQNVIATTMLVLLGWQYSTPPFRLKEIPILDSLSNGLIVLLTWFVGYTFGGGSFSDAPRKGYLLALCTAGVHALGAVIDVEMDVAAGHRTIATFLGPRFATALGTLPFVAALYTQRWNSVFGIYLWGALASMLASFFHVQWAHQAFIVIVFWTVCMSMVWFAFKAWVWRR